MKLPFSLAYPIDNLAELPKRDTLRYAAAILKVAKVDRLHEKEKSALITLMEQLGLDEADFEKAQEIADQEFQTLIQNSDITRVLAPYMIRDVALVSVADEELSETERQELNSLGATLGLPPGAIDGVVKAALTFTAAIQLWRQAVEGLALGKLKLHSHIAPA